MAPTSCFNGQVNRLPDAPEAYGAMITRAKAAPGQSRSADLRVMASLLRMPDNTTHAKRDDRPEESRRALLSRTFDEDAELYDRARPGYPPELYDDLTELGVPAPAAAYWRWAAGPARRRCLWPGGAARSQPSRRDRAWPRSHAATWPGPRRWRW